MHIALVVCAPRHGLTGGLVSQRPLLQKVTVRDSDRVSVWVKDNLT